MDLKIDKQWFAVEMHDVLEYDLMVDMSSEFHVENEKFNSLLWDLEVKLSHLQWRFDDL